MYVRIGPSDDRLSPTTVTDHVRRLHGLDGVSDRWWRRLFADPPTPVEWLLVATGSDDRTVEYYAGMPDEEAGSQLERVLRGLFPDSYELEPTDRPALVAPGEDGDAPEAAAVEFRGHAERRQDWQTALTPFEHYYGEQHGRVPLAAVVETMADYPVPMVYQALLRPHPDWASARNERIHSIKSNQDTLADRLVGATVGHPEDDADLPPGDDARIEALKERNARQSFTVNARLLALADDSHDTATATRAVEDVATAFDDVGTTTHRIDAAVRTGADASAVREAVQQRTVHPPGYERLRTRVSFVANTSRGIVADPGEAPAFCLLDGGALTTTGDRALATTPPERTAIPRPPDDRLATYQCAGLALGRPRTQDDAPAAEPVALPPDLQPLHAIWLGKTGSGKSTALLNAIRANHGATDGPDILVDRKGDGMARQYLRAHHLTYGSLEDVYYFDCTETLPALSFFDIRDQLAAGIDRSTAVEDVVEHYVEMLKGVMGADRYERAVRSPDVIRYLVKAMFDPVHGDDAFSHRDLQRTVRRMADTRDAPAVTDPDLEEMLGGVAANSKRSFDELMQGVANRIEKVPVHDRLGTLFNHVHAGDGPQFDFADVLDDDAVVIVDVGGLRAESQRVLTLVLLSNLWTALRRRATDDPDDATDLDRPLVNLYLEEAADIAQSDLVGDLLAQSRSFGLSVTLAMQFPGQLRERDREAYVELLNNVSTVVTGNVGVDRDLTRRLATDDMPPEAVGNRLRSLSRGEWLTSLPAPFSEEEPRPFLLESLPLPPGHPDGDQPLDDDQQAVVDAAITRAKARTREQAGIEATTHPAARDPPAAADATTEPHAASDDEGGTAGHDAGAHADTDTGTDTDTGADADADGDGGHAADADAGEVRAASIGGEEDRIATTLPFTKRLPHCVTYDAGAHTLRCSRCERTHPPSLSGLERAVQCCHDMADVDPENVPAVTVDLLLSPEACAASDYSVRQLVFLQVVVNAQRREYDPALEYDILFDSMIRLQEYVGLDDAALQQLRDDGLLRQDCEHPHRLYSVTPAGRDLIDETAREGIDHGDGAGDLGESSQHVLGVELGRRLLERAYADADASDVDRVQPYYERDDGRRLDVVGLDADGEVVVAVEVERINHDVSTAVPEDYDKMAACDPDDAIWITMTQSAGHRVLETLNDPPDGDPRVEKSYSPTTPPQQFRLDTPGCTDIYSVSHLRARLDDPPVGPD